MLSQSWTWFEWDSVQWCLPTQENWAGCHLELLGDGSGFDKPHQLGVVTMYHLGVIAGDKFSCCLLLACSHPKWCVIGDGRDWSNTVLLIICRFLLLFNFYISVSKYSQRGVRLLGYVTPHSAREKGLVTIEHILVCAESAVLFSIRLQV